MQDGKLEDQDEEEVVVVGDIEMEAWKTKEGEKLEVMGMLVKNASGPYSISSMGNKNGRGPKGEGTKK